MELLFSKVRLYNRQEDSKLPTFSYSKIDVYKKCPFRYKLLYIENRRDIMRDTLPTEMGTLCHYILESKGKSILNNETINTDNLFNTLEQGYIPEINLKDGSVKTSETVNGLKILREKYGGEYYLPDKNGLTYDNKISLFKEVIVSEMEDDTWKPLALEQNFDIVYDERIHLHGFIDRIDINVETGELRVLDYKTSKTVFPQTDLPTPLQLGIYALACYAIYNKVPINYIYRFILINQTQYGLTKGWEKRLDKALTNVLDKIEESMTTNFWKTCPTPLCHWCEYSSTNPQQGKYSSNCLDHSEWTPTNTQPIKSAPVINSDRKLIFW